MFYLQPAEAKLKEFFLSQQNVHKVAVATISLSLLTTIKTA
jgi:hypothetical protein